MEIKSLEIRDTAPELEMKDPAIKAESQAPTFKYPALAQRYLADTR